MNCAYRVIYQILRILLDLLTDWELAKYGRKHPRMAGMILCRRDSLSTLTLKRRRRPWFPWQLRYDLLIPSDRFGVSSFGIIGFLSCNVLVTCKSTSIFFLVMQLIMVDICTRILSMPGTIQMRPTLTHTRIVRFIRPWFWGSVAPSSPFLITIRYERSHCIESGSLFFLSCQSSMLFLIQFGFHIWTMQWLAWILKC
jgi:hypothetical protein